MANKTAPKISKARFPRKPSGNPKTHTPKGKPNQRAGTNTGKPNSQGVTIPTGR